MVKVTKTFLQHS